MLVKISDREYTFRPGDLIIIPANTVHSIMALDSQLNRYAVVQFNPSFVANFDIHDEYKCIVPFISVLPNFSNIIPAGRTDDEVADIIRSITNDFENNRSYSKDLLMKSHYSHLISWIIEASGYEHESSDSSITKDFTKIEPALTYIEMHYNQEILITDLAQLCNYSYTYFSKLFLKTLSISPSEYLSNVRISKSKKLLEMTDKHITEVATAVGFNDVSHFIRIFKKIVGIPPLKYRNMVAGSMKNQ